MAETSIWNILIDPGKSKVQIKQSRFLAELKAVHSEKEAEDFINFERKKYYAARHHCFAWRIGGPEKVSERSSDDKEPSGTAGKPMLDIMKARGLYDVCSVVSRYFGGTLLGKGGLVKAYGLALQEALKNSQIVPLACGEKIELLCDFLVSAKIKGISLKLGAWLLNEKYTSQCRFSFLIEENKVSLFTDQVRDVSMGKVRLYSQIRVLYYKKPEIVIYREIC